MAKFKVNQKVRIAGTFIPVTILDVFDDGENSKYSIVDENGNMGESTESELRLPLFEGFNAWVEDNPKSTLLIHTWLMLLIGFVIGAFIF